MSNKKCDGCNIKGVYNKYFEKYLCKECKTTNNNYILVTKTNAKKDFLLTEDDLDNIDIFEGKTTSTYGPATYYIKSNLITFACNKYDVDQQCLNNKLNEIITNKNNNKEEKRKNREIKNEELKIKRKNKLILNLKKVGLKFRNDSILYKKYISGDKEFSLEYIISRMLQMKYLYEYCHMDECKAIAYKKQCKELNAGYFPDCSVSEYAEDLALEKYSNGKYPDVYPWQK
jgi:hypothetical protein